MRVESAVAVADRQSPKYATTAGTFIGFVLGAEGRRSPKSEDVATQRPGSPSFVRRPVLPDRVSPARSAGPSGLPRGEREETRRTRWCKGARGFCGLVCRVTV